MLIGVDFDNTIVCYDGLFHRLAVESSLIPEEIPATKGHVRDYLRQRGREDAWTQLQGHVYGSRMNEAEAFPGVVDFFVRCRELGVKVCIISHKTRHPFQGPLYDLHQAAYEWLETHDFYDSGGIGLNRGQVFFELTKPEKLSRIARLGCSHFVDDLPEFLSEPDFPKEIKRILFDPNQNYMKDSHFLRATSWDEIGKLIAP